VVLNTEKGIRHLECADYAYIGLLDSDVEFQADYFEEMIRRFHAEPALGLAGGVVIDAGLPRDRFPRNRVVPAVVAHIRHEQMERVRSMFGGRGDTVWTEHSKEIR
jgi:GT2 family glycosyltransferase